MKTEPIIK